MAFGGRSTVLVRYNASYVFTLPVTFAFLQSKGARHAPYIRFTQAQVVPYGEVSAEYEAIEGEGDGSLEHWREAHWAYFSRVCKRIGREPSQAMPVVCKVFEVLSVLPNQDA